VLGEVLVDGLHLSSTGYKLLYDALKELIEREWPDQVPEALDPVFAPWNEAEGWVDLDVYEAENREK